MSCASTTAPTCTTCSRATGDDSWHLPVVADGRVVGIVGISDIADTLLRTPRLSSVVIRVRHLGRSLGFYQPLLRYTVTVSEDSAALLAGPSGSQLYLWEAAAGATGSDDGTGLRTVAWTVGTPDDLQRCAVVLKDGRAYVRTDTVDGITVVEGTDPDGLPVLISHPGPEQAPRGSIHLANFGR